MKKRMEHYESRFEALCTWVDLITWGLHCRIILQYCFTDRLLISLSLGVLLLCDLVRFLEDKEDISQAALSSVSRVGWWGRVGGEWEASTCSVNVPWVFAVRLCPCLPLCLASCCSSPCCETGRQGFFVMCASDWPLRSSAGVGKEAD